MVFPWFSYDFPIFPWFSNGFPMVWMSKVRHSLVQRRALLIINGEPEVHISPCQAITNGMATLQQNRNKKKQLFYTILLQI